MGQGRVDGTHRFVQIVVAGIEGDFHQPRFLRHDLLHKQCRAGGQGGRDYQMKGRVHGQNQRGEEPDGGRRPDGQCTLYGNFFIFPAILFNDGFGARFLTHRQLPRSEPRQALCFCRNAEDGTGHTERCTPMRPLPPEKSRVPRCHGAPPVCVRCRWRCT